MIEMRKNFNETVKNGVINEMLKNHTEEAEKKIMKLREEEE